MNEIAEKKAGAPLRMVEVASRAGVSISTVSRILAGSQSVAPHLCKKVMEVIEETGYHKLRGASARNTPFTKGDSVNRMRTQNIAFIACEKLIKQARTGTNRYQEMVAHIHIAAKNYGVGVMLVSEDSDQMAALPQEVISGIVDGAIVMGSFGREFMEKLSDALPVVVFNSICRLPALPAVTINSMQMVFKAFDHLVKLGHCRIAFFGEDQSDDIVQPTGFHTRRRIEGYHEAVQAFGLEKEYLFLEKFGENEHPQAVKRVMDKIARMDDPPTAIITGALYGLFIAYEAASRGIDIPGDLSIIATDDPVVAGFPAPDLTAFRSNLEVETTVDLLIKKMEGQSVPNQELLIEPELIVRDSTGPIFNKH